MTALAEGNKANKQKKNAFAKAHGEKHLKKVVSNFGVDKKHSSRADLFAARAKLTSSKHTLSYGRRHLKDPKITPAGTGRNLGETMEFTEELIESVSVDLKRMSGIEFKKKYGKDKYKMRQAISSQPIARKHFGYAPQGQGKSKAGASISKGGNPARKDKVSGVKKTMANRQPQSKKHRKGGIGGGKFGKAHESFGQLLAFALDEFGVQNLAELDNPIELLQALENRVEFLDEEGNSYGPFWAEAKGYTPQPVQYRCTSCSSQLGEKAKGPGKCDRCKHDASKEKEHEAEQDGKHTLRPGA